MAFVYHIHLPEHVGSFDKGYIGFTSTTVESRFKEHLALSKKGATYPIYHAIRKYGDLLVVTTLVEGSSEYCLEVERKLRPTPNLAWNIAVGGTAPMLGRKHSRETKAKFAAMLTPERKKKQSDYAKSVPTWLHGSSDSYVWASADSIYDCFIAHNKDIGPALLARAFNLTEKRVSAILNKFRSGWVPLEDVTWCEWSKTISSKLNPVWLPGDALIEPKSPVLTEAARAGRGRSGRERVWTEKKRQHMREVNTGRKHSVETIQKLSQARAGVKMSDEAKLQLQQRLKERPWTNATANKDNWAKADYIRCLLDAGHLLADVLRLFELDRKSAALSKIVKKLKAGWNPNEDPAWLDFKTKYDKEAINAAFA